jgi:hypothetical protein
LVLFSKTGLTLPVWREELFSLSGYFATACPIARIAKPNSADVQRSLPKLLQRIQARPVQNSRAISREQIHRLVEFINGPDQRLVQPFAFGRSRRRNSNGTWGEQSDVRIVAKVKESHKYLRIHVERSLSISQMQASTDELSLRSSFDHAWRVADDAPDPDRQLFRRA